VIESDYQLYRAITFNSLTDKFIQAVSQQSYINWAYRGFGKTRAATVSGRNGYYWTLVSVVVVRALGTFDFMQSMLQYLMSMIVITDFGQLNTQGNIEWRRHNSSPECNNVDGFEGFDDIIATIASLQAWLLLIPFTYEIAKVLVPGIPAHVRAMDDVEHKRDPKGSWMHAVKWLGLFTPDLWLAALASTWVETVKSKTPSEVGKNSNSVVAHEKKQELSRKFLEAQERLNTERESLHAHAASRPNSAYTDSSTDAYTAMAENAQWDVERTELAASVRRASMAVDVIKEKLKTVSASDRSSWRGLSTNIVRNQHGQMINMNETDTKFIPSFRVISLGAKAKHPNDEHDGLYSSRPGYALKVWSSYPIPGFHDGADYFLIRVSRELGIVTYAQTYDVATEGESCQGRKGLDLARDLDASDSTSIIIVFTKGDPLPNRLKDGLPKALIRCGADPKIFANNKKFEKGCAYVLIGIPTCGAGNGFEVCQGGKKHAVIDVSFEITENGWKMCDIIVDKVDTSWCISDNSYITSVLAKRTDVENFNWKQRQKETMPSYWTLCRLEYQAMVKYGENSCLCDVLFCIQPIMKGVFMFAAVFGMGHIFTEIGRTAWYLVLWKYFKFVQTSLGIWTDDVVESFKIHEVVRAKSVVWDKPVKKRSKGAYRAYRLSITGGTKEEEVEIAITQERVSVSPSSPIAALRSSDPATPASAGDVESNPSSPRTPTIRRESVATTRRVRTKTLATTLSKANLHEESEEQQEVQQQELKRKLRFDYAMCLSAMLGTRVVLMQLIPQLTLLSIYASIMSHTPIAVFSKRLRENMPEMLISAPFAEARAQEQELIDETEWIRKTEMTVDQNCLPNPETRRIGKKVVQIDKMVRELIEVENVEHRRKMTAVLRQPPRTVNEWMVMCNGFAILILESRGINFAVNLFKFALTVGLLISPPEYLKYWMLAALVIIAPYAFVIGLKCCVILGFAMDITDDDLGRALRCIGFSWCFHCVTYVTGSNKVLSLKSDAELAIIAGQAEEDDLGSSRLAPYVPPPGYEAAVGDEPPPDYSVGAGDIELGGMRGEAPPEYQVMVDRFEAEEALMEEEDGEGEETWTSVSASVKHPAGPVLRTPEAAPAAGGGIAALMYDTPVSDVTIHNCDGPRNLDGKLHGDGCEVIFKDGRHYKGPMLNGKMHGIGIIKFLDGTTYFGPFVDGQQEGQGKLKKDGQTVKKGTWKAGKLQQ